jgi:hypothetical protein
MDVGACSEYAEVVNGYPPGSSWEYSSLSSDGFPVAPGDSSEVEGEFELVQNSSCNRFPEKVILTHSPGEESEASIPGSFGRDSQITLGLRGAIDLESQGLSCRALDIVYSRVADVIRFGWLEHLNSEIGEITPKDIGTDVILGILTATLPVKSQLPSRRDLFRSAKRILKSRGHYERGILDGLE